MAREWTAEERAIIERIPRKWPRQRKLTDEQINEIRRRVDSLTTPYSLRALAAEFGVTVHHLIRVARREQWAHRIWEPAGRWWKEVEMEERARERERRKRLEEL